MYYQQICHPRIKNKIVVSVLIGYAVLVMSRQVLGVILGYSDYKYQDSTAYCWNHASDPHFLVGHYALYYNYVIYSYNN